MSNNNNDEKLRILQERLAQIKEQKETPSNTAERIPVSDSKEYKTDSHLAENIAHEADSSKYKDNSEQKKKTNSSFKWLKYFMIIGAITYIALYFFNSINTDSLNTEKTNNKEVATPAEETIEYALDLRGKRIALVGTFQDEKLAKSMLEDLQKKGFKGDYFYLPNKSNSSNEVYKVFIGPYENHQEANQWIENLKIDFEIIGL